MPDIFLSYSREDGAIAQVYRDALLLKGFDVWWDPAPVSGDNLDEATETALRAAKAVVVLWSPRSAASHGVRDEAIIALHNNTLLSAITEPCQRPAMFELTRPADLSHWHGAADDKAWIAFLDDVRRIAGRGSIAPLKIEADPAAPALRAIAGSGPFAAIFPITHRFGNKEMEILAEDLTEEITRELAQNSYFNVIASGTMAAWRGEPIDHCELGRELNASYLVEGRLQSADEDVWLTFQLIDASSGIKLRPVQHVSSLLEIAASPKALPVAVACEIGEHITQNEAARAMAKHGPLSGWDHVMRAVAFMELLTVEGIYRAYEEMRKAVANAPDLGLAHALLARLICPAKTLAKHEIGDTQRREIHEHIQRAMQLDGNNLVILPYVVGAFIGLGDGETGLRLALRAVDLNPYSPRTQFALGQAYLAMGRTADAVSAFREQLRLAPHDLNRSQALLMLGACLCIGAEPSEAEEVLDRALALHPDNALALSLKAIAEAWQGREQDAKAAVLRLRETTPGITIGEHLRLLSLLLRGRSGEAVAIFRRIWNATASGE